jgi:Na+-transporting methylmalonyl-CoA/oxaloacetate decarboxylase gamma subunit
MNNMLIALQISALGMGLVFAAIILLWGMMNLLTFITTKKQTSSARKSTESTPLNENDLKAQAAAVAVAIAIAAQQVSSARPFHEPPTAIISAWQLGMRTRQMYQKGPIRRPRKIG